MPRSRRAQRSDHRARVDGRRQAVDRETGAQQDLGRRYVGAGDDRRAGPARQPECHRLPGVEVPARPRRRCRLVALQPAGRRQHAQRPAPEPRGRLQLVPLAAGAAVQPRDRRPDRHAVCVRGDERRAMAGDADADGIDRTIGRCHGCLRHGCLRQRVPDRGPQTGPPFARILLGAPIGRVHVERVADTGKAEQAAVGRDDPDLRPGRPEVDADQHLAHVVVQLMPRAPRPARRPLRRCGHRSRGPSRARHAARPGSARPSPDHQRRRS